MRAGPLVLALLVVVAIPAAGHLDHVTATSQVSPDGVVHVEKAVVAEPVWLVLHADAEGEKGAPVGRTRLEPTERMEDVPVELSREAWAETDGPRTLWVDLYRDDGDGSFDADEDASFAETGPFAPVSFVVRPDEDRAYLGVSAFDDQETDGTVVVRRAVLPRDGYVAIHNVTRGSPAEVVGHAALPAGEHEDVAIDLDEEFLEQRPFSFPLVAAVYADDGDGELDEGDEPIRVGDDTVSSRFRVVEGDGTPTRDESDLVITATGTPEGESTSGASVPQGSSAGIAVVVLAFGGLLAIGWYRSRR